MLLSYTLPEYHVSGRKGLPTSIQETLLESTRSEWEKHPRFAGKASFFMTIHRDLLEGVEKLERGTEQLLALPPADISETIKRMNLLPFSKQLIGLAHHHHEIEDRGYFPQFELMYPELKRGFSLLYNDHKIIDASLDNFQVAVDKLRGTVVTRDHVAELYSASQGLNNILNRHIWDEEEVIIPIFLRLG